MKYPKQFKALASALGGVHSAVGLTMVGVPPVFALAMGVALFVAVNKKLPVTEPQRLLLFGYLVPVGVCAALGVRGSQNWDAAEAELLRFLLRLWLTTPPAGYLVVAVYMLTRPEKG